MNAKAWIPLGLAVVLGLVAALLARKLLTRTSVPQPTSTVKNVVVAKEAIAPGVALTAEKLTTSPIAVTVAPEQAFAKTVDVTGRVTAVAIVPGQVVLETLLTPRGSSPGLQALVPKGMRAITVEINEFSGVAGLLVPGCRIDLISTLQDPQNNETVSRAVVKNVEVKAVGQRLVVSQSAPNAQGAPGAQVPQEMAKSVTLLVTPKQAEEIELAASVNNRPRLVLRNMVDDDTTASKGVTLAELRGQPRKKRIDPQDPFARPLEAVKPTIDEQGVAVAPPPVTKPAVIKHSVTVIRGGQESNVTFELPPKTDAKPVGGAAGETNPGRN